MDIELLFFRTHFKKLVAFCPIHFIRSIVNLIARRVAMSLRIDP